MIRGLSLVLVTCLISCGGKAAKPQAPTQPAEPAVADEEPAAPEPPPKPPKEWSARASLAPNKGQKLKPFEVSFKQIEDQETSVSLDSITGLKAGTYHLVVHEAAACGANATKAGAIWSDASHSALQIQVAKDLTAELGSNVTDVMLDGDKAIVGHTLVLHDDKKGKPNKAIACGAIEAAEAD